MAGRSVFAVLRIVRPAYPAYDLAGQQIARTLLGPEGLIAILVVAGLGNRVLARLYAFPKFVGQDPQMRYAGRLLELVRVGKRASGAGFRILAIGLSLVFGLADVKPVIENSRPALFVAVDGRGRPLPAARTGNAAIVQFDGDVVR
nr:hypothetical protein [uncultured Sphingomonas sp.]